MAHADDSARLPLASLPRQQQQPDMTTTLPDPCLDYQQLFTVVLLQEQQQQQPATPVGCRWTVHAGTSTL